MRTNHLGILLLAAACSQPAGDDAEDFGGGGKGGDGPRLIAPQSLSTVTQQRPTLRWSIPAGATPEVDLCRDRACTMPLPLGVTLAADGQSAVPSSAPPPGWVFWRVRFGSGAQSAATATWQFWVPASSATTQVDVSSGPILDVNGDGYADFFVSRNDGVVHLYLGSASPAAADWTADSSARRIDIVTPTFTNSFTSVASVGDVNGDGYADFVIATFDAGPQIQGVVQLYFGSADPSATDWNDAASPRRLRLDSPARMTVIGSRIAGVGDVNGDGYSDFLVAGGVSVYLYLGSATPDAAAWNAPPYALRARIAVTGVALARAGDVNGDGYSDFLVTAGGGTLDQDPPPPRLFLGSAAALGTDWNADSTGLRIDVVPPGGASGGARVVGIGDVNADGYSDFVMSDPGAATDPGTEHLFLGSAAPQSADWHKTSSSNRIDLAAPEPGYAGFGDWVSAAGDIDGDGHADFLVAAPGTDTGVGVVHVYLGGAAPVPATWNGATPTRRIDLHNPSPSFGAFGETTAGGGDINGDGHADFLVSGSLGAVWLQLGTPSPSASVWSGPSASLRIDLLQVAGIVIARR